MNCSLGYGHIGMALAAVGRLWQELFTLHAKVEGSLSSSPFDERMNGLQTDDQSLRPHEGAAYAPACQRDSDAKAAAGIR